MSLMNKTLIIQEWKLKSLSIRTKVQGGNKKNKTTTNIQKVEQEKEICDGEKLALYSGISFLHKQFMILPPDFCQVNHNFFLVTFSLQIVDLAFVIEQQISHLEASETLKI